MLCYFPGYAAAWSLMKEPKVFKVKHTGTGPEWHLNGIHFGFGFQTPHLMQPGFDSTIYKSFILQCGLYNIIIWYIYIIVYNNI